MKEELQQQLDKVRNVGEKVEVLGLLRKGYDVSKLTPEKQRVAYTFLVPFFSSPIGELSLLPKENERTYGENLLNKFSDSYSKGRGRILTQHIADGAIADDLGWVMQRWPKDAYEMALVKIGVSLGETLHGDSLKFLEEAAKEGSGVTLEETEEVEKLRKEASNTLVEVAIADIPDVLKDKNTGSPQIKGESIVGELENVRALIKKNGVDLREENREINLSGIDFSNASLQGADLSGITLAYANIANSNLKDANLSGTNLTGANFEGADLTGADLTGATGLTAEQLSKAKGVASVQGIDNLRDQALGIQRQGLKEALGSEQMQVISVAGKLEKNSETEELSGLLMENANTFKKLDPYAMDGEELDAARSAVSHSHKVVVAANDLLGDNAAKLQSLPETVAHLTPREYEKAPDTKALERDTKVVDVFLNLEGTLDAYRGAVLHTERDEHKVLLQGYLEAGGTLPKAYETLEPYISQVHMEKPKPGTLEDVVAFTQKVQSGEIKTPISSENGAPLNLFNKLTVDALYLEKDGRKDEELKATKSFLERSGFSKQDAATAATYIADNHPALMAPLSTDQAKILRVDYPVIHLRGSALAARDPQFFDRWKEGVELIDETQAAVKSALETSGGKLTPDVVKTLAEYDKKALGHLEEQVRMTPDTYKAQETAKGKTEIVEKDIMFGQKGMQKSKEETLDFIQEKIGKADDIAANPDKQFEKGGAVDKAQILGANEAWKTKKENLVVEPEKKRGFFSRLKDWFIKDQFKGYVISGPFNVKHEGGVDISKEDIAAHAARDNIDLQGKTPQKGTGELIQGEINQNANKKEWDGVNNRTKEGRALRKEVDSGRKTPEEASSVFKALRGIMGHHSKRGLPTIEEVGKKETPHAANTPAKNGQQKGHSAEI